MILEYGARNYFSFKEWVTISFRLNPNCPTEFSQGEEFTRVLGVKGANASGKTNILKALSFMSDFCCNSFSEKPEQNISVYSFFNNIKPIELYVEFKIKDVMYRYEVELTQKKILRETIYRTVKRESKVIERLNNELTTCNKDYKALKVINLRDNASIISSANQYQVIELNVIYRFFKNINANVYFFGLHESTPNLSTMSKHFIDHKNYFDFAKAIITKYDSDILDIEIHEMTEDDGSTRFYPIFIYNNTIKKLNQHLTFYEQSSGTKTLYLQLARYKFALDLGGVLVLDEFDIYLHPAILPDLLSLFVDKNINKKNAQLIFTTHNTSILDYLGKYRSYLVNKDDNESYAYRLDEIPGDIIRNDRDISPIYKSGKIGGVPKL